MVTCSLVDFVCWIVNACLACVWKLRGETQEEHVWNLILRRSDVDDDGATFCTTSTNLRAHATAQSGLSDAVRASNNLSTAQVRKDTPSLIDVKGLGRPKELTGREENFQQWSKKMEVFFAGVIKESERTLEWAAEQPTEITTTAIDLEFLPTDANADRGVQNLEFVVQQMHTALTSMKRTTLSPTRERIHRRRGGDSRSDMIRRQEGENETFCSRSFLLDGALFWNFKRVFNAGSPTCLATRRR